MDRGVLGSPLRSSRRWTAADFLLHGRYCEPETIADAVERLRGTTESRLALLIAYRGETLFHSLLLLADANRTRGNRWQTTLLTGPRWRGQSRSPLERFAEKEIDDKQLLVELRRQPPFERIAATLRGHLRIMSRSSPSGKVSDAVPLPAAIHVILVDPKRDDDYEVDQALDELLVMANGSAAVVVHGNLEAERTVDAALDRISGKAAGVLHRTNTLDPSVTTLSAFAHALLRSAITLTNSRLGNVYLAKRDGEHLELLAHERNAAPRALIRVTDPTSVVSWVYRRRRPMVINNIPDFLRVHPASGVIDVAGAQGEPQRELAVPIIQHSLAGGAGTVIGVVNVEKLRGDDDDDDGGYSYRDVTVLRSVAHRIALWRASSMVQQTSATLAGLMKMSTSAAEWPAAERTATAGDARIPTDAIAAHAIIEETLRSVYRLTRSYTATICLLSPDRRWLTRFASYPNPRCAVVTAPPG
ncbi:MAG: GAF domain-containing protein [Phenylobacterium sp.]|nr:MAG: GAF domain-containing protein [Phenylobacterium sp.]